VGRPATWSNFGNERIREKTPGCVSVWFFAKRDASAPKSNERIGELFGVSYSSISHIVKTVQTGLGTDKVAMEKFVNVYSLFKI
jgi:hypothetical protein